MSVNTRRKCIEVNVPWWKADDIGFRKTKYIIKSIRTEHCMWNVNVLLTKTYGEGKNLKNDFWGGLVWISNFATKHKSLPILHI